MFTCTLYIADLHCAIKISGKCGGYHPYSWYNEILSLTFKPSHMQHSPYSGSQNVVVFHEAGRKHHLTSLFTGNFGSGSVCVKCDATNYLEFDEPACDWYTFDFDSIDEILSLPPPRVSGFRWECNTIHNTSSIRIEYLNTSKTKSCDSLGTKYRKPSKLDIILEEINQ